MIQLSNRKMKELQANCYCLGVEGLGAQQHVGNNGLVMLDRLKSRAVEEVNIVMGKVTQSSKAFTKKPAVSCGPCRII